MASSSLIALLAIGGWLTPIGQPAKPFSVEPDIDDHCSVTVGDEVWRGPCWKRSLDDHRELIGSSERFPYGIGGIIIDSRDGRRGRMTFNIVFQKDAKMGSVMRSTDRDCWSNDHVQVCFSPGSRIY